MLPLRKKKSTKFGESGNVLSTAALFFGFISSVWQKRATGTKRWRERKESGGGGLRRSSGRKRLLWQIRFACHGTRNTARAGKPEGVPLSQSLNQLNGWQNQRGLGTCVTRGVTGVVDAIGKILNIWCRASRGCRCDDNDDADEILRAARISSVVQKIKSHRPSSKRNRV